MESLQEMPWQALQDWELDAACNGGWPEDRLAHHFAVLTWVVLQTGLNGRSVPFSQVQEMFLTGTALEAVVEQRRADTYHWTEADVAQWQTFVNALPDASHGGSRTD